MNAPRPWIVVGALGFAVGAGVLACFGRVDRITLLFVAASVLSGATTSLLWWAGRFLPSALGPSPGVSGIVGSFVPALFIPEAYFIGAGLIFMLVGAAAGGTVGIVYGFLRTDVRGESDEKNAP